MREILHDQREKSAWDTLIEKAVENSAQVDFHAKQALRKKMYMWAKHAKPGNWAAKELEHFGLDMDFKAEDHGNQI